MPVDLPQIDLPRGITGASSAWDVLQASALLEDDYFSDPEPPIPPDPPDPSGVVNGFAGGTRNWYMWKGKRLYLTAYELSVLLSKEMEQISRKDLKVKKKKKVRTVSPEVWGQIMASIESLAPDMPVDIEPYESDDDDEEALEALLQYL